MQDLVKTATSFVVQSHHELQKKKNHFWYPLGMRFPQKNENEFKLF